jgi:hypothetical protein
LLRRTSAIWRHRLDYSKIQKLELRRIGVRMLADEGRRGDRGQRMMARVVAGINVGPIIAPVRHSRLPYRLPVSAKIITAATPAATRSASEKPLATSARAADNAIGKTSADI